MRDLDASRSVYLAELVDSTKCRLCRTRNNIRSNAKYVNLVALDPQALKRFDIDPIRADNSCDSFAPGDFVVKQGANRS